MWRNSKGFWEQWHKSSSKVSEVTNQIKTEHLWLRTPMGNRSWENSPDGTEYIKELHITGSKQKTILTTAAQGGPGTQEETEPEVLRWQIEEAGRVLKNGKVARFDNRALRHGGEGTTDAFLNICNNVMKNWKWLSQWTESLIIPLPRWETCINVTTTEPPVW